MMKYLYLFPALFLFSCNPKSGESRNETDSTVTGNRVDTAANTAFDSVNAVLAAQPGNWRVVTDETSGLTYDAIEYFVDAQRKANPDYPYLSRGDYNCDGRQDLAVLAADSSGLVRLAFLYGDGRADWWQDDMQGAALKNFPKQEFGAMKDEEELKVSLPCDAVEAEWFEKAVQVIYWDGKKFTNVWTAD